MAAKQQTDPDPVASALDCEPAPDCKVCAANWGQLNAAKNDGKITQAARHAAEIRNHSGISH